MRSLNYFQCELCNTIYSTEDECNKCEQNHKTQSEIVESEYHRITERPDGYPVRLILKFDNDLPQNFAEYDFCKVITRPVPQPEPEPEEPVVDEPEHSDDEDVIPPEDEDDNDIQEPEHSDDEVVVEEEEDIPVIEGEVVSDGE